MKSSLFTREIEGRADQPLLIFINGVPVTSLIYDQLAQALNAQLERSVLMVDLPGTGKSHNTDYSWSASQACLHEFLRNIERDFILVVHDIAGPISIPLLADTNLKTRGAIIFNTVLSPTNFRPVFPMNVIRAPLIGAVVSSLMPPCYFEKEIRRLGIARNAQVSSQAIRMLYDDFAQESGKQRLHAVMRGFELTTEREAKITEGLQSTLPKLAIWGIADPALGTQHEYLTRGSHIELQRIQAAKHFLMLDQIDEIVVFFKDFLSKHSI